jgi:hypothetical protein
MSSGRDRKRKDNSSSSSNPSPSKSPRVSVESAAHEPSQNEGTLSIHDEETLFLLSPSSMEYANRKSISPLSRFPTPASQVVIENQTIFSSDSIHENYFFQSITFRSI